MRAQLEKRLAQKEKERKEENLRELAKKAREERAGIRTATAKEGETQRRQGTRARGIGLVGIKCGLMRPEDVVLGRRPSAVCEARCADRADVAHLRLNRMELA